MKCFRWMLVACLAVVLRPGLSFGQASQSAGNRGRPVAQTPYGQDKNQSRAEQGNRGRPVMQAPYGQDKSTARRETGTQSRPIKNPEPSPTRKVEPVRKTEPRKEEAKDTKKEEAKKEEAKQEAPKTAKDEKKEDEQKKDDQKNEDDKDEVADLPGPTKTQPSFTITSSGWDVSVTPQALGGERYIQLVKGVAWVFSPQTRIAGFHVYEQAPGETGFHLYQSIDLKAEKIGSQSHASRQFTSQAGYTMLLTSQPLAAGETYVYLSEWRRATAWPVGTYRHYVVACDTKGREGKKGSIVSTTNLGEFQVLLPKEGGALRRTPIFQWSDIWPAELQSDKLFTYPGYGATEVVVSEEGKSNHWHVWLPRLTTSALYWFGYNWTGIRGGHALLPGHQYYLLVHTWGGNQEASYVGYSRLVGFTVQ